MCVLKVKCGNVGTKNPRLDKLIIPKSGGHDQYFSIDDMQKVQKKLIAF